MHRRTEQFGSSYRGSAEMSPIQAGKSRWGIFGKLVFGSLTPGEWASYQLGSDAPKNLAELNRLDSQQQATWAEKISGGAKLTYLF